MVLQRYRLLCLLCRMTNFITFLGPWQRLDIGIDLRRRLCSHPYRTLPRNHLPDRDDNCPNTTTDHTQVLSLLSGASYSNSNALWRVGHHRTHTPFFGLQPHAYYREVFIRTFEDGQPDQRLSIALASSLIMKINNRPTHVEQGHKKYGEKFGWHACCSLITKHVVAECGQELESHASSATRLFPLVSPQNGEIRDVLHLGSAAWRVTIDFPLGFLFLRMVRNSMVTLGLKLEAT